MAAHRPYAPNPFQPRLEPLAADIARPLWSVMIPTYNCAGYLRETLDSVLRQDPGPELMQIEVVDDCSTMDDPEAVVAEVGRGRVAFYRRPENGGHLANFDTCLRRSRGRLIHLLHGDDAVRDGFYRKLQQGFEGHPEIGAAFCRQILTDEHGHWHWLSPLERQESGVLEGWLERIAVQQLIQTPAIVVRREVYEHLGTFDRRLAWVEDWEMWTRIAAYYPIWYEVEPLALYRMHSASNSSKHMRSGENLRDVRRAVAIIRDYLPAELAPGIGRRSLEFWATDALANRVPGMVRRGELRAALVQMREALHCSRSPRVLALLAGLLPAITRLTVSRGRERARQYLARQRARRRGAIPLMSDE